MKGPDGRIDARYPVTYIIRKAKLWLFMNRARDRAWQAKGHEQSATTSNMCHPH
jgi:hypothetical protein